MPQMDAFSFSQALLYGGVFITGDGIPEFSKTDKEYQIETDAVEFTKLKKES
jgi:hypothetical protein